MNTHEEYIKKALQIAQDSAVGNEGHVGAVLVSKGEVIATGASNDPKGIHAEQDLFSDMLQVPHDSTLYVTIQPTLYRTDRSEPSDSDIIAQTGIMHVVVGSPNKKYSLEESANFFKQHGMTFTVITNEQLQSECLDYFLQTGASQE